MIEISQGLYFVCSDHSKFYLLLTQIIEEENVWKKIWPEKAQLGRKISRKKGRFNRAGLRP